MTTKKSTKKVAVTANVPALATNSSPAQFLAVLEGLSKQVKHIEETPYKTGTNAKLLGMNIQSETSVENLVKAHSYIVSKSESYKRSLAALDVTAGVFKEDGHTADQWEHDIKLRIQWVNSKSTIDAIAEMKKEAQSLLTNEDKKELLAAKIAKFAAQGVVEG